MSRRVGILVFLKPIVEGIKEPKLVED